jgi:hypothetical protein
VKPRTAAAVDTASITDAGMLAKARELCVQIEDDVQGFTYHTDLTSIAVYGGVEMGQQERALKSGVDIIVNVLGGSSAPGGGFAVLDDREGLRAVVRRRVGAGASQAARRSVAWTAHRVLGKAAVGVSAFSLPALARQPNLTFFSSRIMLLRPGVESARPPVPACAAAAVYALPRRSTNQ